MIKKISFSLMVFAGLFSHVQAQNQNLDFKYAIKIYNMSSYEKTSNPIYNYYDKYDVDFSTTKLQLLHPTIAFQWNTKLKASHEVEITSLTSTNISKTVSIKDEGIGNDQRVSQGELNTTYVSLRYEYIRNFNTNKNAKFIPSIGGSFSPYYQKVEYSSDPAYGFPSSQLATGIKADLIPRLTYHINSKFFVDLNFLITIHDFSYMIIKEENQLLPDSQKQGNQFQLSQFPGIYSGRLGIGFKI